MPLWWARPGSQNGGSAPVRREGWSRRSSAARISTQRLGSVSPRTGGFAVTADAAAADRGARPPWLSKELYPFESHYAQVDGASVHYVDEGAGPPLLLLHGNPTWSFLYRDIIKALRDRYRCIAPDHPGFGL